MIFVCLCDESVVVCQRCPDWLLIELEGLQDISRVFHKLLVEFTARYSLRYRNTDIDIHMMSYISLKPTKPRRRRRQPVVDPKSSVYVIMHSETPIQICSTVKLTSLQSQSEVN